MHHTLTTPATREPTARRRTSAATVSSSNATPAATTLLRLVPARQHLNLPVYDLPAGRFSIGGDQSCELICDVEGVAPRHCLLMVGAQRTLLKTFSPLTWVNERAVTEATLNPGDLLTLGPVVYRVEVPAAAPGAVSESASGVDSTRPIPPRRVAPAPLRHPQPRSPISSLRPVTTTAPRSSDSDPPAKVTPKKPAQSVVATESATWEQMLQDRHEELSRRSHELVQRHRSLRQQSHDVSERELRALYFQQQLEQQQLDIRSLTARHVAQQRQLARLGQELEQRDDANRTQQSQLARELDALRDQQRTFNEERRLWAQNCRQREKFLDELDRTLARQSEEIEASSEQLKILQQEILSRGAYLDERQQHLEIAERQTNEAREQLQKSRTDVEARDREIAAFAGEISQQQLALQTRLDELDQQAEQLRQDRDALTAQQQAQEIAEADLQSRQALLQTRVDELESQQAAHQQAVAALSERDAACSKWEQSLISQEAALGERAALIESSLTTAPPTVHSPVVTAPEPATSTTLDEEREALSQQRAEIQGEAQRCAALRDSLHLAEQELETERAAQSASRRTISERQAACDAREQELSLLELELLTREELLAQQQREIESLRQELASQSERAAASLNTVALEQSLDGISPGADTTASTSWAVATDACETSTARVEDAFTADERQGEEGSSSAAGQFNAEPAEEVRFEAVCDSDTGPESAENAGDAALKLRAQLASLFGLQSVPGAAPGADADAAAEPDDITPSWRPMDQMSESEVESDSAGVMIETHSELTPTTAEAPANELAPDDDNYVAEYMARLLARNRGDHPAPPPAPRPQPTPEPTFVAQTPAQPSREITVEAATYPEPPVRRREPREKQLLMADLKSFRELANQSARTAVAKSHINRKSSHLHLLSMASGFGWMLTAALLSTEYWMDVPQRSLALAAGLISTVCSGLAALRYYELRQLEQARMEGDAEEEEAPSSSVSVAAPMATTTPEELPPPKSGSLTFM